jgi:hypothetical protein
MLVEELSLLNLQFCDSGSQSDLHSFESHSFFSRYLAHCTSLPSRHRLLRQAPIGLSRERL